MLLYAFVYAFLRFLDFFWKTTAKISEGTQARAMREAGLPASITSSGHDSKPAFSLAPTLGALTLARRTTVSAFFIPCLPTFDAFCQFIFCQDFWHWLPAPYATSVFDTFCQFSWVAFLNTFRHKMLESTCRKLGRSRF